MILKEKLSRYQNRILVIALFLTSIAISIRSSEDGVRFVLQDYPIIIFFLILISLFLVALYFKLNQTKIEDLSNKILELSKSKYDGIDELVNDLTDRQKEVYQLIISGKTNKEIMSELFIEQSTLKTHINQIYKKLNIKNRKELKSISKDRL